MKKPISLLLLASSMLIGSANAATLTFDDVPGGSVQNSVGNMPTYQGYNFSSTLDWLDLSGSSWNYGAHSGEFGILNNNGGVGTITKADGSDFLFGGLWAKRWANNNANRTGTLQGYINGSLVWSVATTINATFQLFGAQASVIDELRLGFGGNYLVDDIELNNVPVPAAAWLFGSAMIGLVGLGKRKHPKTLVA